MQHTLSTKSDNSRTELLNPLKSSLLNIFPVEDGWKLYNRYSWATRIFDFVLQKESNDGLSRIVVEINFEAKVTREHFSKLNDLAKRLDSHACGLIKKIMIVDDMANLDKIPADVEIIPLGTLLKDNLMALEPKLVA